MRTPLIGSLFSFLALLLIAMAADSPAPVPATADADLKAVKERLYALYLRQLPDPKLVQWGMDHQQPDGSYPGFNYAEVPKVYFPVFPHLERVRDMAMAYKHPDSPLKGDPQLKAKWRSAFDFWLNTNPTTHHNWYMVIGEPVELAKILVLMEDELTPDEKAKGLEYMKRGYENGDYHYEHAHATGQNMIWIARLQMEVGVLSGDYPYARQAIDAIGNEIRVTREEGIQPDFSFHQHGPDQYVGGYDTGFIKDNFEIASLTMGTSLAIAPEKTSLIGRLALDGHQWASRASWVDFNALSRDIAWPGSDLKAIAPALRIFATLDPSHTVAATAFADRLELKQPPEAAVPVGNRAFWCSDYMSHQRPAYHIGIKTVSSRTVGAESGNGQAEKSYYLGTGAMSLLKTGKEYDRIYVLWNWRRIPGITAAQSNDPYPLITWGKGAQGTTPFAGGASDGTYGVAALDFDRDGIKAHKGWFCFDDEVVCLGAGISSEVPHPVFTTLEQNWAESDLISGDASASAPVEHGKTVPLPNARWILHGTTGYFFPTAQKVTVQTEIRTGSWHDLEPVKPASDTQTGEVFTVWIDHGQNPQNAAYSYIVLPKTDAAALKAYQGPKILSNTPQLQAVWHDGLSLLEAVFYEPGQVVLPSGQTFAVDKPALMVARLSGQEWKVTVSDPTELLPEIHLKLSGPSGAQECLFTLPAGFEAGKSVTLAVGGKK